MAGGFGRIAEALAQLGAGIGGGYGKGMGEDYMNAREQYMQQLKDQKAAQMAEQDRVYRSEEAEKGRGFEKEMFGEKQAWDEKKFGMEQAAEDARFDKQSALQLKLKGMGGGGGSKDPASISETKILAEKMFGKEYTPQQFMEVYDKYNATKSGGGGSVPASVKVAERRADLRAKAEQGDENAKRQLQELETLTNPRGGGKEDAAAKDMYSDVQDELESMSDVTNPSYGQNTKLSEEERMRIATEKVAARRQAFGLPVPGMSQESKTEAPQSQTVEAPATSTKGDKPTNATPPGQGNEANPFMITTEEQKEWFLNKAPGGSYFAYKGQVRQKPKE